jgi:predicted PurR-regulated permease PerM
MTPPSSATTPEPPQAASRTRRLWIFAGLWTVVLAILAVFWGTVGPFAAAALLAYIVEPLVSGLTRVKTRKGLHLPRWGALLLVYALFFLAAYLFLTALVPQLYREGLKISRDVVDYANTLTPERIQSLAHAWEEWFAQRGIPVSLSRRALSGEDVDLAAGVVGFSVDLEKMVREWVLGLSSSVRTNFSGIVLFSRHLAGALLASVFTLFFTLMIAAFLSIDAKRIRPYFRTLVPPDWRPGGAKLLARIDRSMSGVVRGQLTIAAINGVLTFVGLLIFRVKFAFLLATVATLFSVIPIFGTILSSLPILLIAVTHSWRSAVGMLLWILGIHALEAYILNPKIMGSAAKIHPVVVAFALLAGEHAGGVLGALLALPVCAVGVAAFEFARESAQPPALPEAPATDTPPAG